MAEYQCRGCGKTVERDSDKQWVKSYCDKSGRTVHLQRKETNDASMVGNMGNPKSLCGELDMASQPGEAVGGRLLDMCGGNHDLRDAEPNQVTIAAIEELERGGGVTLCQCGQELKTIDDGGHVRTACCNQIVEGCCGDF